MAHADGYRYFISRPTTKDGMPEMGSEPSYFRFHDVWEDTFSHCVEYRLSDGEWKYSTLENIGKYLDDALGSGATVREILDEKEIPNA